MRSVITALVELWSPLAGALTLLLSVIASAHVVLHKRDSRAAVAWVGLIWLAPIVGAVAYVVLGINRIRRKAADRRALHAVAVTTGELERPRALAGEATLPVELQHLTTLARLVDRVGARPLTEGNAVFPLANGDETYPAMLSAIDGAERSIALSTYIFDNDAAGRRFLDALERAAARGVQVRVLIDTVGARYSWPPILRELRRRNVHTASFGRTLLPWRLPYVNLRNHRKIIVVDGRIGFTGGINIREGHVLNDSRRHPVQDVHFRLEGPVVSHLMQTFAEDWGFTTREVLDGERWFPPLRSAGQVAARGITDGPDADLDKARLVYLGALACAQRSVRILSPYFLPDQGLITALNVAALRGVKVEIILPEFSNLALVQWAATAQLWQVLQRGCRIYYNPPPFDHSKLMLVDDGWALIGSSNWDARSLRLNFEFNVECYDVELTSRLSTLFQEKLARSRHITKEDVDRRSLPVRLRDGIARLAAPYL